MSTSKQIIVAVVVALLVSLGVSWAFNPAAFSSALGSGGNITQIIDFYAKGVGIGNEVIVAQRLTIPAGSNQVAWKNTTGRDVYVSAPNVGLGYASGTASSSLLFYVGTSTSATFTDYARPTPTYLLMDGASVATSTTGRQSLVGTTTSAGRGFVIPNSSYLVFDVQEMYACKTIGACETATSTNRGITNFTAYFQGHYAP